MERMAIPFTSSGSMGITVLILTLALHLEGVALRNMMGVGVGQIFIFSLSLDFLAPVDELLIRTVCLPG